jgi:hypothetical protein
VAVGSDRDSKVQKALARINQLSELVLRYCQTWESGLDVLLNSVAKQARSMRHHVALLKVRALGEIFIPNRPLLLPGLKRTPSAGMISLLWDTVVVIELSLKGATRPNSYRSRGSKNRHPAHR